MYFIHDKRLGHTATHRPQMFPAQYHLFLLPLCHILFTCFVLSILYVESSDYYQSLSSFSSILFGIYIDRSGGDADNGTRVHRLVFCIGSQLFLLKLQSQYSKIYIQYSTCNIRQWCFIFNTPRTDLLRVTRVFGRHCQHLNDNAKRPYRDYCGCLVSGEQNFVEMWTVSDTHMLSSPAFLYFERIHPMSSHISHLTIMIYKIIGYAMVPRVYIFVQNYATCYS